MGDSIARWTGQLPPVSAFAPDEPLSPDPDKLPDSDDPIKEAFAAAPKPDWSKFYAYYESLRLSGRLPVKAWAELESAEELRGRAQRWLTGQDTWVIGVMHGLLLYINYPYQNLEMLGSDEQQLLPFISAVEPLPPSLSLQGLESSDPRQYSLEQLEELRKRGQAISEALVRRQREAGNAHFARAAKLSGAQQERAYAAAEREWMAATLGAGGMESVTSMCNLAALYMKQKK